MLLVALVVLCACVHAAALSIRIGRTNSTFSDRPAGLGSSVPLFGGYVNLQLSYVTLQIGTPPQSANLHLDTGSATLGVFSTACPTAQCNADGQQHLYDMARSATAAGVPCTDPLCRGAGTATNPACLSAPAPVAIASQCAFHVFYADSSAMHGVLTQDTVALGSMSARAYFGRITATVGTGGSGAFEPPGVDGILGLAYSANNCNPSCFPTVLDSMAQQGQLQPYLFSMCLQPTYGTLDLGVVDPYKYSGTMQYLALITNAADVMSRYYTVYQRSLALGGSGVSMSATQKVIFDSGTTLIILSNAVYASLSSIANAARYPSARNLFSGYAVVLSAAQIAAWPALTFTFPTSTGGVFAISVRASQYLVPWVQNGRTYYYMGIDYTNDAIFILGDVFLQTLYVVYDQSQSRLGVAPVADCAHVYSESGCAPGQFTGNSGCVDCQAGSASLGGAVTSCSACAIGTFAMAPKSTACSQCAPGSFNTASGLSSCTLCVAGSAAALAGASSCSACIPGAYSSLVGSAQCTACAIGKFSTTSGATACVACAAGAFASSAGATVCTACATGSVALAGASSCTICAAGSFALAGSSSCVACASGSFASGSGASACTVCPFNTFSAAGSTLCTACAYGTTTASVGASACTPIVPTALALNAPLAQPVALGAAAYMMVALTPPLCSVQVQVWSATDMVLLVSSTLQTPTPSACAAAPGACQSATGSTSVVVSLAIVTAPALYVAVVTTGDAATTVQLTTTVLASPCPLPLFTPLLQSLAAGSALNLNVRTTSASFVWPVCNRLAVTLIALGGAPRLFVSTSASVSQPAVGGGASAACTAAPAQCFAATPVNGTQTVSFDNVTAASIARYHAGIAVAGTGQATFQLLAHVIACSAAWSPSPSLNPPLVRTVGVVAHAAAMVTLRPSAAVVGASATPAFGASLAATVAAAIGGGIDVRRVLVMGGHADAASGAWLTDVIIAPDATLSDAATPAAQSPLALAATLVNMIPTAAALVSSASTSVTLASLLDTTFAATFAPAHAWLCPDGSWQPSAACLVLVCDAGQALSGGGAGCQACTAGTVAPWSRRALFSCNACPAGSYTSVTGALMCQQCAAGTASGAIAAASAASCSACNAGGFSASIGSSSCSSCAVGSYSARANSTTCASCALGSIASVSGSSTCVQCVAGRFAASSTAVVCAPCASGYAASAGASSCLLCSAGRYSAAATSCVQCGPGTITASPGLVSCWACAAGSYAGAGNTACVACPSGSAAPSGSSSCSMCSAGTYSTSNRSACAPCAEGTFSSGNTTACLPCQAGKFALFNNGGCAACPIGTYSSLSNSAYCTDCPAGTYSSAAGASSCASLSSPPPPAATTPPAAKSPVPSTTTVVAPAPALLASAVVSLQLSCALNIAQTGAFQQSLRVSAANALAIAYQRVLINAVRAGSVIVDFKIVPDVATMSATTTDNSSSVIGASTPTAMATVLAAQAASASSPLALSLNTIAPALLDASAPALVSFLCGDGATMAATAAACPCAAGQYKGGGGACFNCTPGTFRVAPLNDAMCATCASTAFQPGWGASACLPCPFGHSANAERTACGVTPTVAPSTPAPSTLTTLAPVIAVLVSVAVLGALVAVSCCVCRRCPCHESCAASVRCLPCCRYKGLVPGAAPVDALPSLFAPRAGREPSRASLVADANDAPHIEMPPLMARMTSSVVDFRANPLFAPAAVSTSVSSGGATYALAAHDVGDADEWKVRDNGDGDGDGNGNGDGDDDDTLSVYSDYSETPGRPKRYIPAPGSSLSHLPPSSLSARSSAMPRALSSLVSPPAVAVAPGPASVLSASPGRALVLQSRVRSDPLRPPPPPPPVHMRERERNSNGAAARAAAAAAAALSPRSIQPGVAPALPTHRQPGFAAASPASNLIADASSRAAPGELSRRGL